MKNNIILVGIAALIASVVYGGLQLVGDQLALGAAGTGYSHYQTENFLEGFYGGRRGQLQVTPTGTIVTSANVILSGTSTISGDVSFTSELTLDHLQFQTGSSTNTNLGASATSAASWFCGVSFTNLNGQTVSTTLQLPSSSAVTASTACDLDELGEFVTITLDNTTGTGDILFTRGDNSSTIRFNRGSVASTTQFQATDYMRLTIQNIGVGSQLGWFFEKFLVE